MKQLGTLDTAFLNLETPTTPQHIGSLAVYDPATADGPVDIAAAIRDMSQRLQQVDCFRRQLVQVPGGIDRPYWRQLEGFDPDYHIRRICLPAPGTWSQLWEVASQLHSEPLDQAYPLWELYVIEGINALPIADSGSFALYTKIHHSMIDGDNAGAFMASLHDLEPHPCPSDPPARTILINDAPDNAELLLRSSLKHVTDSQRWFRDVGKAASKVARYGNDVARKKIKPIDMLAPATRFNEAVQRSRTIRACNFPLLDFKAIKKTADVTLNDVALCVISGAMRSYLNEKHELPEESLLASMPLNMRQRDGDGDDSDENNRVGSAFTALHTDIKNPAKRLHAIHRSAMQAKALALHHPMTDALRIAGFFTPNVSKTLARFWARHHLSRYLPMNVSTVVTNVAGPDFPLYCQGAKLVSYHGLGLLTPGCGLFHTVFSNNGTLSITTVANEAVMPDIERYTRYMELAFEELWQVVVGAKVDALPNAKQPRTLARKSLKGARKRQPDAGDPTPIVAGADRSLEGYIDTLLVGND